MRAIGITGLLVGVVVVGGCDRNVPTAPRSNAAAAVLPAISGNRPYTWSVKCAAHDPLGPGGSIASWSWTAAGASITGTEMSVTCFPDTSPVTGSGTRPTSANGFSACVNTTCQSWTFDPAGAFQAQLKGSETFYVFYCGKGHTLTCKVDISATLYVDS